MTTRTYFSMVDDRTRLLPVFLKGMGYNFEQTETIRPDGFEYYHLMQTRGGEGVVKTADHVFTAGPGDVVLLFAGRPHHYYPRSKQWHINWITFGGSGVPGILRYLELDREGLYTVADGEKLDRAYRETIDRLDRGGFAEALTVSRQITDLLEMAALSGGSGSGEYIGTENRHPLQPVIAWIASHYSEEIGLEDLCAVLKVTPQHLCLLFRKHLSHTPMEYLSAVRLARAKALLIEHPERQIREIAWDCGFSDPNYFHRLFKKETGATPGQFRLNPS